MGQEPGSPEEIAEFCSATYGVTFPMTEKIEVNGEDRHPIYAELTSAPNEQGEAGDVAWNFEKFLDRRRRHRRGAVLPAGRARRRRAGRRGARARFLKPVLFPLRA